MELIRLILRGVKSMASMHVNCRALIDRNLQFVQVVICMILAYFSTLLLIVNAMWFNVCYMCVTAVWLPHCYGME